MTNYPEDWKVVPIDELATITTGNKNTQDNNLNGAYPFYVRSDVVERIDSYSFDTEGVITAGDGVGTGKIFHYAKGKFGLHQRAYLIHEFHEDVDAKYFYWFFSYNFYDRIHGMTAKSSVDSVRREMIADMPLAYPPLPEQRRIAAALGDMDKLIENLTKRIEKKRAIKEGAMQELLTGRKRLCGASDGRVGSMNPPRGDGFNTEAQMHGEGAALPVGWRRVRLGETCQIGHGRDYKHLKAGDIPVYGTGGFMCSVDECLYDGATVCIGRKGTIDVPQYHEGKIWTVDTLFYTHSFVDTLPKFLYYVFYRIDWLAYNAASGVPSLTAETIEKIKIALPPLPEQQAIAGVLGDMDAEITKLEAKREKLVGIKKGMMSDLLTGRVRLKSA